MKWTTTITLGLASVALAKHVRKDFSAAVEPQLDGRSIAILHGMKGKGITLDSAAEVVIIWANPGGGAATTTINEKVTVTQTVTAGNAATAVPVGAGATTTLSGGQTATVPATGASHTVTVGGPGGLIFQPDQLSVPVGDTVIFEFLSQNHTVTQSPFATPCKALAGGMDSGFLANPNNTVSPPPQVAMQVMVATPLWFYCAQKGHCGNGMVFSVNPTAAKTQAMFQALAIQQNGTGAASPITGGTGSALPPPAAASSAAPVAAPSSAPVEGGATPGTGTVGTDGSCKCVVQCAAGAFPAVSAQGIGAFGGQSGSLPLNMVIS